MQYQIKGDTLPVGSRRNDGYRERLYGMDVSKYGDEHDY